MPTSLAEARGGARLALVRERPAAASPVTARATVPSASSSGRTSMACAEWVEGDGPPAARDGAATTGTRGRVAGAIVLVTLLGTVLLATLVASATLAWAGR